ncbi:hypothetical protein JL108_14155 [Aeromicrobium sp. YIM 150415]|uniref:hypothetical protein n=1 Tax=Aeromicrobium sp. YIM 150415 TaxID=2803912 RepID=UPI001963EC88|nr:hypothetical protein [Aeromicrobium sp. YIM 150415]MBM9464598.1 hypothetical protein [Aeromicrobium sp. YIM 150415]
MVKRAAALLVLVSLTCLLGCVTVTQRGGDEPDRPEPIARQIDGDVETWDLSGPPSDAAFGIVAESSAGIYRTDEPRTIVLRFSDDEQLRVEAPLISFSRFRGADGDNFTVGIRGATVEPEVLDGQLRSIVDQLGSSPDLVADFTAEVKQAPPEQTERIVFSSPSAQFGDLEIGVQANLAPIAGSGRFVIGGAWS